MASDTFLGTTYDDLNPDTPTNSDSIGVTAAAIRQIKSFIKDDTEGTDASMHGLKNFIKQLVLTDNDIKQNFIENIYKVGDIILTLDEANPSTRFGGTWEKIESSFLMGASSTYAKNSTGGQAKFKLTMSQLPEHRHGICGANRAYDDSWNAIGKFQIAQRNAMSFNDAKNNKYIPLAEKSAVDGGIGSPTGTGEIAYLNADAKWLDGDNTAGNFDKVDYVNVFTIGQQSATNYSSYTQTEVNTLPPYLAVYIWKKIA